MENIRPDILEIIILHLQKGASQPEEEQLLAWMNESPQNKASFEEVAGIWKMSAPVIDSFEANSDAAWEKVKQKTILTKPLAAAKEAKIVRFPDLIWKVAASLLLLIGIGYALQSSFSKDEGWTSVASNHEKRRVQLPDSSIVWLNKNSSLSYSDFSGERRLVKLEGEAFFEVTRKPGQPFQISGLESMTEVLGTSFNLCSRKGKHDVLEVVTGLVAFSPLKNPESALQLKPGQKGEIQADGKVLETRLESQNSRSWQTGQLNFDNVGLAEVCSELESYFSVNIEIQNEALKNCHFTGSFEKPVLKDLLQILSLSANLQVEKKDSIFILKGNGCP